MINTATRDYAKFGFWREKSKRRTLEIGRELQSKINKKYKYLQIDIDYVFQKMLLLKKKKYAAVKVLSFDGKQFTTQRETRGIDLVRRDWSILTKDAGSKLLDILFSEESRDEFADQFGRYLTDLANNMRANLVPYEKYEITVSLTRSLADYKERDVSSLPHVVVAKRLSEHQTVNISTSFMRSVIHTVICCFFI